MSRVLSAALLSLIVAIGATVGAIAMRLASFDPGAVEPMVADPAIGFAFYDALNAALATGDATALKAAVGTGFIDHREDGSEEPVDALADRLVTLSESYPMARFPVRAIESAPGTLVVSLETIGPLTGTVAGMPVRAGGSNGAYDVLRVRNGRVTERWSSPLPEIQLQTFSSAARNVDAATNTIIRLERVKLPPNGSMEAEVRHPMTVMVDAGTVAMTTRIRSSNATTQDRLGQGAAVALESHSTVILRATEETGATLLVFSRARATASEIGLSDFSAGTRATLLWSSYLPIEQSGRWQVSFGRILLPENCALEGRHPDVPFVLLAAEGGQGMLSLASGSIALLSSNMYPWRVGLQAVLDSERAARVEDAQTTRISNAGDTPMTVWVVSFSLLSPDGEQFSGISP